MGLQDGRKTAGNKEKQGEKEKEIEKEENKNTTKTATILWRFLLAFFFDYKTGFFFEILAIFMPTNRGDSHSFPALIVRSTN